MTVLELISTLSLEILSEGDLTRKIEGCYCSDLLSHCMSNISCANLWITVQVNINIVAIAALTELSAIIISQGMNVEDSVIQKAKEEGITILRTDLPSFELCMAVGKII